MNRFDDRTLARLRHVFAAHRSMEIEHEDFRKAAVVAPLLRTDDGWSLLFCRRSEDLPAHSGQIAFPGGGVEPGEPPDHAALRETEEEVGIPASQIELIGRLDDLVTISGYIVAPFVGIIPSRFDYVLQQTEVTEVYEVPVDALMDRRNPEIRPVAYKGRRYPSYFYHHGDLEIWGLTGRMVKAFLDVVWLAM